MRATTECLTFGHVRLNGTSRNVSLMGVEDGSPCSSHWLSMPRMVHSHVVGLTAQQPAGRKAIAPCPRH